MIPSYLDYSSVPNNFFVKSKRADGSDPYANERNLFSSLICESYNKFGVTMTYYVVSFNLSADRLNGEDNDRSIIRKFDFMAYYQLPKEDRLFSKFGIEGLDQFSVFVSKLHFNTASKFDFSKENPEANDAYMPKIGDIILAQYNNSLLEITDVKEETGMFLLSKQHIFEFICRPYRDEHLNLLASTSADMVAISPFVDKEDPFDIKNFILSAAPNIEYVPPSTEKPSDEFWNT
jgi:hypothetical protein